MFIFFKIVHGRAKIPMARPNKPWYFPESSKILHDYMFIIPGQPKNVLNIFRLEKLHSDVNERTHAGVSRALETALLQKFWREFCINECVCHFVFSPFYWSNTVIQRWWKFYFCSWLSRDWNQRHQAVCNFVWNRVTLAISWKIWRQ